MRVPRVFLSGLFLVSCCTAASAFPEDLPAWGSSRALVLQQRRPFSVIGGRTVGLLFPVPVYALLAQERMVGRAASVLYFFHDDRLIEFAVSFSGEEANGDLYCELKNRIQSSCRPYDGTCFPFIDDRFVDEKKDSLYLLVNEDSVMLFALDIRMMHLHEQDVCLQDDVR